MALNAAREKVRVARALEGLPHTSEAFRRGEFSYSKVRALTRVATDANEAELADLARRGPKDLDRRKLQPTVQSWHLPEGPGIPLLVLRMSIGSHDLG